MTIETGIYTVDWETSPRIVTIADSTTEGNAQDLYDTLMYYESAPGNIDNSNIVSSSGKEELAVIGGAITSVGLTVTLLNARYKFADRGSMTECIMSGGNVLANDEFGVKMYPVEPSVNVFSSRDMSANATINTIEVSTIAYSLELNGQVYLDVDNGSDTGTHLGTIAKPVKTLTKALEICASENISTIQLAGILVLDQDVSGREFISWRNGKIDMNNQPCVATRFRELKLYGNQRTGSVALAYGCRIGNLQNLLGVFDDCKFVEATPLAVQSGQISIGSCAAQVVGFDLITLDLSAGNVELEVRALSAGLRLLNVAHANDLITAGFVAGVLQIDSSCVTGNIYAGGSFQLIDNSGAGCLVHTEGKNLSHDQVAEIATGVHEFEIETGYSFQDFTKLIGSASAGKLAISGNTVTIRDMTDTTDRITATTDTNGQRTAVTHDVS